MRSDMAKVVTERPRRGHAEPSVKTALHLRGKDVPLADVEKFDEDGSWTDTVVDDGADFGPSRIKASRMGQCRHRVGGDKRRFFIMGRKAFDCHKDFSDLLGPLKKYLRKQVGRPWDKVYSELSETLDKRSLSGIHIWGHVRDEVATNCYVGVSGKIWEITRYGSVFEASGLFVHPRTRLLTYKPKPSYRGGGRKPDADVVKLTDARELKKVDGIWYDVTYITVKTRLPGGWTEPYHWYREARDKTERLQDSKRQLSRRELKTHGLKNDAAGTRAKTHRQRWPSPPLTRPWRAI